MASTTQSTHTQPARRSPGKRLALRLASRYFNPYAGRNAGSPRARVFALVRHRGRRSGREYATPVAARPIPAGFIIPLTFGPEADWYQNIAAAGGCVVVWKGVEHELNDPRVVGWPEARAGYSALEGFMMTKLMGISRFARLREAPPAP